MASFENGIFRDFEEFHPDLQERVKQYNLGGKELQIKVSEEAELRNISPALFVASSMNVFAILEGEPGYSGLFFRESTGFLRPDELDIMSEVYNPIPFNPTGTDKIILETTPEVSVDFVKFGVRNNITTREVMERVVRMGLDISRHERDGDLLILKSRRGEIPLSLVSYYQD